jgi:hypothetical protein
MPRRVSREALWNICRTNRLPRLARFAYQTRMLSRDPNAPPEGWLALDGLLVRDATVNGYAARGDEVKGRCHQRDCRRTCQIDMARLVESGFGRLPVEAIKRWLRCSRPEGCALDFQEERPVGLRLKWLLGRAHVTVRFTCQACKFHRDALPDRVFAKIQAKGPGAADDATVEGLGKLPMEPCKNCGKRVWRIEVLWANVNSMGWRAAQARTQTDT